MIETTNFPHRWWCDCGPCARNRRQRDRRKYEEGMDQATAAGRHDIAAECFEGLYRIQTEEDRERF